MSGPAGITTVHEGMHPSRTMDAIWRAYFWREYGFRPGPALEELHRSQYWTRQQLDALQFQHLSALRARVLTESPWYQRYAPSAWRELADVTQWPHLVKADVRQHGADMMLPSYRQGNQRMFRHSTSGSSGDPLQVLMSDQAQAYRVLGRYRYYSWWGTRPYDRNILIWSSGATFAGRPSLVRRAKQALRKKTVDTTLFLNVFELNATTINSNYHAALCHRPVYLRGYLSAVLQFAELLQERHIDAGRLGLKVVIVTSETLHADQRHFLQTVFNCPVANEYGGADAGLLAFDCEHQHLHIFEEAVHLSVLDDGRAVSTEYRNTAMPMINYINEDVLELNDTPCPCGRTLRRISAVQGRISDMAISANGDKVSAFLFYCAVKELDNLGLRNAVKKYKVVQNGRRITFHLVADRGYTEAVPAYLTKRVKAILGDTIEVVFERVPAIEREKSGKLRFFVRET